MPDLYDGRVIKSEYRAEDAEGVTSDQVLVSFADEAAPSAEVMHIDELTAAKQAEGEENKRNQLFSEVTLGVRTRLLREVEKFNPRYKDLERLAIWLKDDLFRTLDESLENAIFDGYDSFSFKNAFAIIEKNGGTVDHGDASDAEKALTKTVVDLGISFEDLYITFNAMRQRWESYRMQAIQAAVGVPAKNLRLDDAIKYLEEKVKAKKEKEEVPVTE